MVSCSNDDIMSNGASGDEVQLSFNLGLENAAVTRAIGDGQTVNTLSYAVYNGKGELTNIQPVDLSSVTFPTQVKITLAKGQDYQIVFWADEKDSNYSFDATTANISVNYNGVLNNNEGADAFFANLPVNVVADQNIDVTLKRPFAQINVGTIDKEAAEAAGVEITQSSVKISGLANTLNLLSGEATASEDLATGYTFNLNNIPNQELSVDGSTYDYMSMTYVLLPHINERQVINAEFTFKSSSNDITLNVPSVPAQRNYRTNILGSILTSQVDINVKIDADFEEDDYIVRLGLEEIALNGGYFSLPSDIVLSETLEFTKDATINLNGHTISMVSDTLDKACPIKVINDATVTIEGEGIVYAGKGASTANIAVWAASGNVIINGGTYTNGNTSSGKYSDLIYTSGGSIEINGGYFETYCTPWNGKYYVLNQHNSLGGPITVTGGTFVNYNPANGDDNLGGNFVKPGYTSIETSEGVWTVVEGTYVANSEEFAAALQIGGKVILTEDINLPTAVSTSNDVNIEGNGKKITGKTLTFTGNVSIKDVVFENAQGFEESSVYIYYPAEYVTIEGCTFNAPAYEAFQLTSYNLKEAVINGNTFNNTKQAYRNIHIEMVKDNKAYIAEQANVSITNNTFINPTYTEDAVVAVYGILQKNTTLSGNIVTGNDAVVNDYYFGFATYDRPNKTWVNFDWSFVAAGFSAE
jgi:hypothetical protein